ncbi:MAG TPA: flagellar basal body P-ring formation chaperone FlgA [Bryobacteraceae bacterium]|nr:flagellar basal body P-ring formation chaperone FlgA [Bryobacteraceae bacterium]
MSPLAEVALAGCLAVNAASDHIVVRDLAAAIPGLETVSPDVAVALAPAPGVKRTFRVPELRRLAVRLDWPVTPDTDVCVERPLSPPDPTRFLAAMQKSIPQARIEILEYSRQPLPAGDIEFPAAGLRQGATGALWTGCVRYAGTRRFSIWARVRAVVTATRILAASDLTPGQAILPGQLSVTTREEFPVSASFAQSIHEVAGRWPRLSIHAGTAIRAGMLESPKEVMRGEMVRVDVRSGGAHLAFEAEAEASGAAGETIPIRNPTTNKRFQARVESKGRVSVGDFAAKVNP